MTPFRRLLSYVLRYPGKFLRGLACVIVTTGVSLVAPRILGLAIDDLTKGVTAGKLALYGTLLLGVAVVGGVFRFLMRRVLTGVSRDIEYDMRNDFFAHLQTLPLSYFQTHTHRRPDVARDKRSQCRADDDRAGGDVRVEHRAGVRRCSPD